MSITSNNNHTDKNHNDNTGSTCNTCNYNITLRQESHPKATTKGSVLSFDELDNNFISLMDRIDSVEQRTIGLFENNGRTLLDISYFCDESRHSAVMPGSSNKVLSDFSAILSGKRNVIETESSTILSANDSRLTTSSINSAIIAATNVTGTKPHTLYTTNIDMSGSLQMGQTILNETLLSKMVQNAETSYIVDMVNRPTDNFRVTLQYSDGMCKDVVLLGVKEGLKESDIHIDNAIVDQDGNIQFSYNGLDENLILDLTKLKEEILCKAMDNDAKLSSAYMFKEKLILEVKNKSGLINQFTIDLSDAFIDKHVKSINYIGNSVIELTIADKLNNHPKNLYLDLTGFKREVLEKDKHITKATFDPSTYLICYEAENTSVAPTDLSDIKCRLEELELALRDMDKDEDFAIEGYFDSADYDVEVIRKNGGSFFINLNDIKKDIEKVKSMDNFVRSGDLKLRETEDCYELILTMQFGEVCIPMCQLNSRFIDIERRLNRVEKRKETYIENGKFSTSDYDLVLGYFNDCLPPLRISLKEIEKQIQDVADADEHITSLEYNPETHPKQIVIKTKQGAVYTASLASIEDRLNELTDGESFLTKIQGVSGEEANPNVPKEFQYNFVVTDKRGNIIKNNYLVLGPLFDYINNNDNHIVDGFFDKNDETLTLIDNTHETPDEYLKIDFKPILDCIAEEDKHVTSAVYDKDSCAITYTTNGYSSEEQLQPTDLSPICDCIDENTEKINDNRADIDNNRTDIDNNSTNINQNRTDIDNNRTDIDNNRTDIDNNRTDINNNRTDIDDNSQRIDELEGRNDVFVNDVKFNNGTLTVDRNDLQSFNVSLPDKFLLTGNVDGDKKLNLNVKDVPNPVIISNSDQYFIKDAAGDATRFETATNELILTRGDNTTIRVDLSPLSDNVTDTNDFVQSGVVNGDKELVLTRTDGGVINVTNTDQFFIRDGGTGVDDSRYDSSSVSLILKREDDTDVIVSLQPLLDDINGSAQNDFVESGTVNTNKELELTRTDGTVVNVANTDQFFIRDGGTGGTDSRYDSNNANLVLVRQDDTEVIINLQPLLDDISDSSQDDFVNSVSFNSSTRRLTVSRAIAGDLPDVEIADDFVVNGQYNNGVLTLNRNLGGVVNIDIPQGSDDTDQYVTDGNVNGSNQLVLRRQEKGAGAFTDLIIEETNRYYILDGDVDNGPSAFDANSDVLRIQRGDGTASNIDLKPLIDKISESGGDTFVTNVAEINNCSLQFEYNDGSFSGPVPKSVFRPVVTVNNTSTPDAGKPSNPCDGDIYIDLA